MASSKITEKEQVSRISESASLLITQPETVDGLETETLRRAPLPALVDALLASGVSAYTAPPIPLRMQDRAICTREAGEGRGLMGLSVHGVTALSKTPQPDAPATLNSPGDGGSVRLSLFGRNLYNPDTVATVSSTVSKAQWTVGADGWIDVTSQKKYDYLLNSLYFLAGLTYTIRYEMEVYGRPEDSSGETKIGVGAESAQYFNVTANGSYVHVVTYTPDVSGVYDIVSHANAGSAVPAAVRFRITCMIGSYTEETMPAWTPCQEQRITLPYLLRGVPVASGGNYTDANGQQWATDEIDFSRGVYVKRVGAVQFTGTEAWTTSAGYCVYINSSRMDDIRTDSAVATGLCSHFDLTKYITYANMKDNTVYFMPKPKSVRFRCTAYTTVDAWKAFLAEQYSAGTPVTIYGQLLTAEETPLDETLVREYLALRTAQELYATAGGAELDMVCAADTKAYIDGKFAELALKMIEA